MSSLDNTIVAAKQEYTQQLCDILQPLISQGFKTIWNQCKDNSCALKSFQEKICSVPKWNQEVIDNEYLRISSGTEAKWLDNLIEAVFLSNVKILSTIRVNKVKQVNITIPNTKNFIHKCYIETARSLWQDPYLIDDRVDNISFSEIKRNEKRLNVTISEAIEKTISKLIPLQNILESYLNDIEDEEEQVEDPIPEYSSASESDTDSETYSTSGNRDRDIESVDEDILTKTSSAQPSQEEFFMVDPNKDQTPEPNFDILDGDTIKEAVDNFSPDREQKLESKNIVIPNKPSVKNDRYENNQDDHSFFSDSDEEYVN